MQKTKLGISVGLLGAAVFFICFFGGYTAAILLTGYVLLFEDNVWLKRASVKAVILTVCFSLATAVIGLIPNAIDLIDGIVRIFGGGFYITFVSNVVSLIDSVIYVAEKILFIILGLKALNQGTISIPVIDSFAEKHIG